MRKILVPVITIVLAAIILLGLYNGLLSIRQANAEKELHIFQSWAACATYKLDTVKGKLIEIKDMYYPYGTELKDDFDTLYKQIYSQRPASYTIKAINLYSEPNKNSTLLDAAVFVLGRCTEKAITFIYDFQSVRLQ